MQATAHSVEVMFMQSFKRPLVVIQTLFVMASSLWLVACQPSPESNSADEASKVVVYTSRQPHLIEPLFERYTELTGVEVEFTSASEAALIERLVAEGPQTPADVFITVDAGNLWFASERGLFQSIESSVLEETVPPAWRDSENQWFGLSLRARTIVYHPGRVDASELSSYEDLADSKWRGRLCLRTSRKVYNQSLVAMMIEHHGEEETQSIVEGWVANLATDPFSSDTLLIQAIEAGQCDVGIVNTYYLGRLINEDPNYPVALFWANQADTGVHVNISGGGVTRYAPRPDAGKKLIEWLVSEEAQVDLALANLEFPVNSGVPISGVIAGWGEFVADSTPLVIAGQRQAEAVQLLDRAGYR